MSAETNSKVLAFVETASKAIEVGDKLATKLAATQAQVAKLVPGLVEGCKSAGLIDAPEAAACAEKLSDPVGALEVFGNLLDVVTKQAETIKQANNQLETNRLGSAEAGAARAKVASTQDNFVGRRRTVEEGPSESDLCLLRILD